MSDTILLAVMNPLSIIGLILLACWLASFLWAALPGLTSLSATIKCAVNWTATLTAGGGSSSVSANSNSSTVSKSITISTSAANAAVGGGDELYCTIVAVSASSSTSVDFTSVSDIMGQTAGSFARLKALMIQNLSTSDDSTYGTAAAYGKIDSTVTNGLASQSGTGWAEAVSILDCPVGGFWAHGLTTAGGVVVDSTHKVLKLTNTDGAIAQNWLVTAIGGHS